MPSEMQPSGYKVQDAEPEPYTIVHLRPSQSGHFSTMVVASAAAGLGVDTTNPIPRPPAKRSVNSAVFIGIPPALRVKCFC